MENIKKIIIAENEPIIALDLQKILSGHSLIVTKTFTRVKQVFDYINNETPDLLITALYLEKSKNYFNDLIKILEEKNFPVIFLSAAMSLRNNFIKSDSIYFLKKPFKNEEFISIISRSLNINIEK